MKKPTTAAVVLASNESPDESPQRLEVCLREFGFSALTAEEFIQAGVEELNNAAIRTCRAGAAFWAAHEALKSTDSAERTSELNVDCAGRSRSFKDWIADSGLEERRIYEAIALAKFFARLPEDKRQKMLTIGKKSALLLASLPQEVIDQAADTEHDLLDKADLMTVAELKEEIKRFKKRERNYEDNLELAQRQVARLTEEGGRLTALLPRTEDIRAEALIVQAEFEGHLARLRTVFDDTDSAAPEGVLQIETVWIAANTLAARALDLVAHIRTSHPDALPDRPRGEHILSTAEAEAWLLNYPLIENRQATKAALRQEARDEARPRGRGRPSGSKNKGGEA